jgi:RNA polymerase sigma-70 factor (ECF subfamily)
MGLGMDVATADSADTQHLLQRIRAGEQQAREQLFARHRAFLLRFVRLRADPQLRARLDPSDIVQETQIIALRRLENYLDSPKLCFRLWLRQLAYDQLLQLRRRHVRTKGRTVERDVSLPADSSVHLASRLLAVTAAPSTELLKKEFIARVRAAVLELADADREIVLLRNFEELSNQEVVQLLGIKAATASRRYGRALIRLREILMRHGLEKWEH